MSVWRFSLVGLLATVTFAAAACGALVNPNEWWTLGVTSAAVALLAYAALAAIYGAGVRRAFWGGAAIVGWGYFGLVAFALGFNIANYGASPLVTCKLLGMLGELRFDAQQQTLVGQGYSNNAGLAGVVVNIPALQTNPPTKTFNFGMGFLRSNGNALDGKTRTYFYTIGHCLWSLILGVLGGLVALRLALARERQAS